jgi:hypothetical protein
MKIEILKPIKKEKNPTNCYKFVIGLYDESEVYVKKDHPYLERFINFLERCESFDADENFEELEDSWLFVPETNWECTAEQEVERDKADLAFDWLSDVAREGYYASFDYYGITFFDEQGIEHEVKITK